jgi:hypothetical protein
MFKTVFLIALPLIAVHLNAQTTSAINRDTALSEKIDTYLLSASKRISSMA